MQLMDLVRDKLSRAFSGREAQRIIDETLEKIGLEAIRNPDDLLAFGTELTKHEGLLGVVGGSLRVQARVHGAAGD